MLIQIEEYEDMIVLSIFRYIASVHINQCFASILLVLCVKIVTIFYMELNEIFIIYF